MSKVILFILCVMIAGSVSCQVINIENKRFLNDTNGFIGDVGANLAINQNRQQVINLGINNHLQYQKNKHRILTISDFMMIKAGNKDFVNAGFQHFRYNYKINEILTWEAFAQAQFNKILLLDRRYLAGTGPRFRICKEKNIRIYAACLYMYEYEVQNNDSITRYNNRLSTYVTFSLNFGKNEFTSTTYFQPNLNNVNDYRIANDSNFELNIKDHLTFRVNLNLLYDTRQPPGIPALTYIFKNGLNYKF